MPSNQLRSRAKNIRATLLRGQQGMNAVVLLSIYVLNKNQVLYGFKKTASKLQFSRITACVRFKCAKVLKRYLP